MKHALSAVDSPRKPRRLARRAVLRCALALGFGGGLAPLLAACTSAPTATNTPAKPAPTAALAPTTVTAKPEAAPSASAPVATVAPAAGAARLEQFTVALNDEFRPLDPAIQYGLVSARVQTWIFDRLIAVDDLNNSQLVPVLATEWRRTDDRTLEVTLRQGVTFQDGSPFTATDVKYTFDRLITTNPELGLSGPGNYPLASVDVVNDYKVKFVSTEPDPVLELRLAGPGAEIIPAAYHQRVGDQAFRTRPIGTGPYKVVEFVPAERMVLEAHDNGLSGAPAARRLTALVIPEVATRMAALASGEVDLVNGVSPDLVPSLAANQNLTVKSKPTYTVNVLHLKQTVKPFDKREIRQAINIAIDRKTLTEGLFGGYAIHTRGLQFEGQAYFNPNRPLIPFDRDRAKALLQQGGYAGEEIIFLTFNTNYYTLQLQWSEVIMSMLRDVGINAWMNFVEVAQQHQIMAQNPTHMYTSSVPAALPDPEYYLWRSYGPSGTLQGRGLWPAESAQNYNQIAREMRKTMDRDRRYNLVQQALDELDQEVPSIVLFTINEIYAMKKSIDWNPYRVYDLDFRPKNLKVR